TCVCDNELAVIEYQMADETVDEVSDLLRELGWLIRELRQRLRQPVTLRDVPSLQGAQQLGLMVAGDAQGVAGVDHAHHEAQHRGRRRAAVDEVADEEGPPAGRMVRAGA